MFLFCQLACMGDPMKSQQTWCSTLPNHNIYQKKKVRRCEDSKQSLKQQIHSKLGKEKYTLFNTPSTTCKLECKQLRADTDGKNQSYVPSSAISGSSNSLAGPAIEKARSVISTTVYYESKANTFFRTKCVCARHYKRCPIMSVYDA